MLLLSLFRFGTKLSHGGNQSRGSHCTGAVQVVKQNIDSGCGELCRALRRRSIKPQTSPPDKGFTLLVTGHPFKLYKERSYSSVRASYFSVRVINVWNSLPADRVDFSFLLPSNRQLNRLILVSFYSAVTTELVLAELLCCDCECVFCNSLVFYVSAFYFIL